MSQETATKKPSKIFSFIVKLQNPMMKWLLKSPFHGFVSNMYMLITFTGRKSGTVYTTPVQYKREGNKIYVITSQGYTWWKNLRGGAEVQLLIQKKLYTGHATTTEDKTQMIDYFGKIYPKMSPEKRAEFAKGTVAITIELA